MNLRIVTVIAASVVVALQPHVILAGQATPVELASRGDAAGAWKAWSALPAGPGKLRRGVEVAAALKDIDRGLELYEQLRAQSASTETESLRVLALGTAASLLTSKEPEARVTACSAALRLDNAHGPCREMLETMASKGRDAGEQALGAYALADANLRPFPGLFTSLEQNLGPQARLMFAGRFTRLPAAERISLIRPLVSSADISVQYQAILALGAIRHPDALALLRNVEASATPVRLARTVALAQQQDPLSLQAVADALPTLDNYLKIPASLALAQARDARGSALLNDLMTSPVDLQRILAAEAVTHLNRSAAAPAILGSLANGSPAIKPAALRAAGLAGLGADRAVYSALGGADPIAQAQAVEAIASTLAGPVVTSPVAPPPPTPLQP